ncbi:MAG: ribosomal protein S18-alanine N-acetyltransferase [Calditrichae bacterium]|nr:ribosomal protein S18-alanine N-acetyltransferase [Calditrichia bacterium]NIW79979.1 ribosomal protein S18-alanine N-acetyltransferase [Calditrichia bacterium]
MNSKPVIRPMASDDLDTILEIEQQVFRDPWSRQSYQFEINSNRLSRPVVLEYMNEIIGSAVVWNIYREFHIATISISPMHQGRGWGEYFLSALLEMADNAEFAILEVRRSNTAAISLYKKFGFKQISVRLHYYRNGEDAIIMRKDFR